MLPCAAKLEIPADATYLREQAQRCVRLARDCPHTPTSHQLEAIGVELMEKAAELDRLHADWTAPSYETADSQGNACDPCLTAGDDD